MCIVKRCISSSPNLARNSFAVVERWQLSGELNMKQPAKFILESLLANFISRPDFIAYDVEHRNRTALKLCKALFKAPIVYWTVKDRADYDALKSLIIIFEGFEAEPIK